MGYESWYLKASHPTEPLGIWIRYTTHERPGEPEKGSLWCTLFGPEPRAAKVTPGPEALARGGGAFIRIGDSTFSEGRVQGTALEASWDLSYESPERELRHLPKPWMYRAPIPRTKLMSPYPAARFSGSVTFGDRTVDLDRWPGMVGHNWGSEHAERWIWLHGSNFEGHGDDTWLDVAIGRIKVGPWTTPWVANGVLSLHGQRTQIGGLGKRGTKVEEHPDRCRFTLAGVEGEVSAPRERFVGWIYADPDGSEHNVVNCSIAAMSIRALGEELRTDHGAAYEFGMRETDHGVAMQPFPDG